MNDDNLIKNIEVRNISSNELKLLDEVPDINSDRLEERKKSIKRKISAENLNNCNKLIESILNEDEKIIYKFRGIMAGGKYLASIISYKCMTSSLGSYTLINLGINYIGCITNERIIFLEVDGINKLMKTYIFNFSDIIKFRYKNKGNITTLDFKYKEKSNDDEINKIITGSLNLGYMFNNRIVMNVTENKSKEIGDYLNKIFNV